MLTTRLFFTFHCFFALEQIRVYGIFTAATVCSSLSSSVMVAGNMKSVKVRVFTPRNWQMLFPRDLAVKHGAGRTREVQRQKRPGESACPKHVRAWRPLRDVARRKEQGCDFRQSSVQSPAHLTFQGLTLHISKMGLMVSLKGVAVLMMPGTERGKQRLA